jgi:nucleoside phosphorylase
MDTEVGACFGGTMPAAFDDADGFPLHRQGEIVVCKTGIGRRAGQAAEAVLSRHSPRLALSVGVAGALVPGIAVGDLVVCSHVDHESHRHKAEETSVFCHEELIERAREAAESTGLPATVGSSLTVDEAAWGPAEKAAHHSWKRHEIVEMESFWIGEAVVKRGIPFLTTRTISDAAEHQLLQTGAMREDGTFDVAVFQAWAQVHPEAVEAWAQTAENARAAFSTLTRFLSAFLPLLVAEHVR